MAGDASAIDVPNWDESVKAIAFYPDILNMMTDNIDWTSDLGYAFLYQPDDVMSSIQRLRWQVRSLGSLESDDQETVSIDGDYLEIIPAQPEYIYVPQYNPTIIYVRRWSPGMAPFMTFGRRMPIGSWLSMDFDWHKHHVIYHGWNRPGWVNNAKRYVHITNVYINKSRPHINQAWLHDASHGNPDRYRTAQTGGVRGGSTHSSEVRGRDTTLTKPATAVFGPRGRCSDLQQSRKGKPRRQRDSPCGTGYGYWQTSNNTASAQPANLQQSWEGKPRCRRDTLHDTDYSYWQTSNKTIPA